MRRIKILLVDLNPNIVESWKKAKIQSEKFDIEIHQGSFLDFEASALVSPANSFLYMNGGIDYPIRNYINEQTGRDIVTEMQNRIRNSEYMGEVLVGQTLLTKIDTEKFFYLISAPTMRIPSQISETKNVYLATRAAISQLIKHNKSYQILTDNSISSILIPGMGTGVGQVSPESCAQQMKAAIEFFDNPNYPQSLTDVYNNNLEL